MNKTLNLGVLGLGEGCSILSAATTSPYWAAHTVCDIDPAVVERRKAEFDVPHGATDLEEMLARPGIDLVAIYTPDHLHARHVLRCLEAGKHVICTKPLVDDLAPGRDLLSAAARAGRHVFVGQSSRFFEPMVRQRADFEGGKNGDVITVEAHYHHDHRRLLREKEWYRSDRFSWVFGGLSHPVDLVRWYLPDIAEVCAYGDTAPAVDGFRFKNPDTVHAILRAADGRVGRVSGCFGGPEANPQGQDLISCLVRGTRGASQGNYLTLRYFTNFQGEEPRTYSYDHLARHYFRFEGNDHHAGEFQNYLDYVGRCLLEGSAPKPDLAEGLVTVAVLTAIAESVQTRRPVMVRDVLCRHGLGDLSDRAQDGNAGHPAAPVLPAPAGAQS